MNPKFLLLIGQIRHIVRNYQYQDEEQKEEAGQQKNVKYGPWLIAKPPPDQGKKVDHKEAGPSS